jgi:hypothetical protein
MFACLFFLMVFNASFNNISAISWRSVYKEMMYTALVSRSDYVFFVKVVLHEGTMTFTKIHNLTLTPELYTSSPCITIHDFFIFIADTGKLSLSGVNPRTPTINEELQLVFNLSQQCTYVVYFFRSPTSQHVSKGEQVKDAVCEIIGRLIDNFYVKKQTFLPCFAVSAN